MVIEVGKLVLVKRLRERDVGGGDLGCIGLDRGDNEVAFEKEHTVWESR